MFRAFSPDDHYIIQCPMALPSAGMYRAFSTTRVSRCLVAGLKALYIPAGTAGAGDRTAHMSKPAEGPMHEYDDGTLIKMRLPCSDSDEVW